MTTVLLSQSNYTFSSILINQSNFKNTVKSLQFAQYTNKNFKFEKKSQTLAFNYFQSVALPHNFYRRAILRKISSRTSYPTVRLVLRPKKFSRISICTSVYIEAFTKVSSSFTNQSSSSRIFRSTL